METKEVHFASLAKTDSHDCIPAAGSDFPQDFCYAKSALSRKTGPNPTESCCYSCYQYIMIKLVFFVEDSGKAASLIGYRHPKGFAESF